MRFLALLLLIVLGVFSGQVPAGAEQPYDLVVYGGTSGGVAAAVQGARMDLKVLLVAPGRHIGGLTSSGLGHTDWGRRDTVGGVSLEFYERVRDYYDAPARWKYEDREDYLGTAHLPEDHPGMWGFEPHAAERVFIKMLHEAGVPYLMGERLLLDRERGVEKDGARITAIRMESGLRIPGRMFIDATYEGDLMAMAGVSYTVGRESNEEYGEFYNGVQKARTHNHVLVDPEFWDSARTPDAPPEHALTVGVDPYIEPGNPESGLLPGVHDGDPGEDGEGDHRVQAYCYRLCLTDVPENRVPFSKPENYDELSYELLFRNFEAGEERIPWLTNRMPNRKNDTNNRWGVSTNFIGENYDYPDGDYETRERIEQAHRDWQMGFLWTLANHPRVPAHVREVVSEWGLPKDEFADNGHWPYQIYVREARRMIGPYVHTELDCRRMRIAEDPVGIGSYNMDSHNVQRYITEEGFVQNEGNLEISPGGPYLISYRSITPKQEECENLLVPVAVSSSHIAFGSIRMEPVFMILGQSAATAAALALGENLAVQELPYSILEERLRADGQFLDLPEDARPHPPQVPLTAEELGGVVLVANRGMLTGGWEISTSIRPFVGGGYFHVEGTEAGGAEALFETDLAPGRYAVYITYTPHRNRARNVPVIVRHAEGSASFAVDQQAPPRDGHELLHHLGDFPFEGSARVTVSNKGADGHVIVDAVRFRPLD